MKDANHRQIENTKRTAHDIPDADDGMWEPAGWLRVMLGLVGMVVAAGINQFFTSVMSDALAMFVLIASSLIMLRPPRRQAALRSRPRIDLYRLDFRLGTPPLCTRPTNTYMPLEIINRALMICQLSSLYRSPSTRGIIQLYSARPGIPI